MSETVRTPPFAPFEWLLSGRYLRAMGFELVKAHPLYWNKVDYVCTRCGKPCVCTAEEMIKYL